MAFLSSFGYTDSNSAKTVNVARSNLNFGSDFAETTDGDGLCILTNTTTPLDQKETVRFQIQKVNNIYSGAGIDPAYSSQNKKGLSLLVQVNDVLRVTSDTVPDFQLDLPLSAHMVIRVPENQYVTASKVQQLAMRVVGLLYATDDNTNSVTRLEQMLRGAMAPSDI